MSTDYNIYFLHNPPKGYTLNQGRKRKVEHFIANADSAETGGVKQRKCGI
jgi:hypothetical protein